MRKKLLLISVLLFCSAFSRPTTFNDRATCEETKGVWRQFGNSCVDECEAQLDEFAVCTDITNSACECGKSRCWNDEIKSCVALSDYKKIFVVRQKEEKKIAEEARKKREEEVDKKQETIISNVVKTFEAKTATNATPPTAEKPQENQPAQPPSPVVSSTPPTIPPLFLQQEKVVQDAQKKEEKNNPVQSPTISIPGLPFIPLPQ